MTEYGCRECVVANCGIDRNCLQRQCGHINCSDRIATCSSTYCIDDSSRYSEYMTKYGCRECVVANCGIDRNCLQRQCGHINCSDRITTCSGTYCIDDRSRYSEYMAEYGCRECIVANCGIDRNCLQRQCGHINCSDRITTCSCTYCIDDRSRYSEYMTKYGCRECVVANCGIDRNCLQWQGGHIDCSDRITTCSCTYCIDDSSRYSEYMTKYGCRECVVANCGIDRNCLQRQCGHINCSDRITTCSSTYCIDDRSRYSEYMTKYGCRECVVANCGIDRNCLQRQCGHINCSDRIATCSSTYCIDDRSRTIKEMTKYGCRECVGANCGIDRNCLQRQCGHINCSDRIATCSCTYCIDDRSRYSEYMTKYGCRECVVANCGIDRNCLQRQCGHINCSDRITTCSSTYCIDDRSRYSEHMTKYGCRECVVANCGIDRNCLQRQCGHINCSDRIATCSCTYCIDDRSRYSEHMTKYGCRECVVANCGIDRNCLQRQCGHINCSDRITTCSCTYCIDDRSRYSEYMTKYGCRECVVANCGIDRNCLQWQGGHIDCSDRITTCSCTYCIDDSSRYSEYMTKYGCRECVVANCGIDRNCLQRQCGHINCSDRITTCSSTYCIDDRSRYSEYMTKYGCRECVVANCGIDRNCLQRQCGHINCSDRIATCSSTYCIDDRSRYSEHMTKYGCRECVVANCGIDRNCLQRQCGHINCSDRIATCSCTYCIDDSSRAIKEMTKYGCRECVVANCGIDRNCLQRQCGHINCSDRIATRSGTYCIDDRSRTIKEMTKYGCRECVVANCGIDRNCLQRQGGHINCSDRIATCSCTYCIDDSSRYSEHMSKDGCRECVVANCGIDRNCLQRQCGHINCSDRIATCSCTYCIDDSSRYSEHMTKYGCRECVVANCGIDRNCLQRQCGHINCSDRIANCSCTYCIDDRSRTIKEMTKYGCRECVVANCGIDRNCLQRQCGHINCSDRIATCSCTYCIDDRSRTIKEMTKYGCRECVVANCGIDRNCLQRQCGHINCSDRIATRSGTYCIDDRSRTIKEMTKYGCRECVVANCGIDRNCLQRQCGHINCSDRITTCSSTYCIDDRSRYSEYMTKYGCRECVVANCGIDRNCLQRQCGHINCSDRIATCSSTYCIDDRSRYSEHMTKYGCRECVVANCGIDRNCLQRQGGHINCSDRITTCSCTYCIDDSSRYSEHMTKYGCRECVVANCGIDRNCLQRQCGHINCSDRIATCSSTYCIDDSSRYSEHMTKYGCRECVVANCGIDRNCLQRQCGHINCSDRIATCSCTYCIDDSSRAIKEMTKYGCRECVVANCGIDRNCLQRQCGHINCSDRIATRSGTYCIDDRSRTIKEMTKYGCRECVVANCGIDRNCLQRQGGHINCSDRIATCSCTYCID